MGGEIKSFNALAALAAHALNEGGAVRHSMSKVEWDVGGGCQSPRVFEFHARPAVWGNAELYKLAPHWRKAFLQLGLVSQTPVKGFVWSKGDNHPVWLVMHVRCRRCNWCLMQRAKEWANKARCEIEIAPRTWFATFTYRPDEQFRVLSQARAYCADRGSQFEALSDDDQFRALVRGAGQDVTRYLKRVRKQSGGVLRYLWVAERHKSGDPHYHALFHDMDPAKPIRKTVLKEQWPHGFSRFKLVEDGAAAWYVCKYLSKDLVTRVRGSLNYGKPTAYADRIDKSVKIDFHKSIYN